MRKQRTVATKDQIILNQQQYYSLETALHDILSLRRAGQVMMSATFPLRCTAAECAVPPYNLHSEIS